MTGIAIGFYGKIPSRGDFVRAGLPTDAVAELDEWCQRALPVCRATLGTDWPATWMEAPIWRFRLGAGVCGALPLAGAWLPSTDRAGRLYPLIVALAGPGLDACGPLLEAAEAVALNAIEHDPSPAQIAAALTAAALREPSGALGAVEGAWWTAGAPRVPACRRLVSGLPDGGTLADMLQTKTD